MIEGNDASSNGFCTNSEIISKTIPKVIFKAIETSTIQGGSSISKIKISESTNIANANSLNGNVDNAPCFAILYFNTIIGNVE